MQVDGYSFMAAAVAKFYHTVYVAGWFRHDQDQLVSAKLIGPGIIAQHGAIGLPHPSVDPESVPGRGFQLQCLRDTDQFCDDLAIIFETKSGRRLESNLIALSAERLAQSTTAHLYHRFQDALAGMERPLVIDIGGRDRSDFDRSQHFPAATYRVVDILPGANVDIVADAHELSSHVAHDSADAVISTATFEHLLMPWKAIVEINRVLKPGGLLCVITHQTLGLHDMPWDFWRYSADAWDGLLNRFTGFEIVERALSQEQYVIPFFYRDAMAIAEQSAGFDFTGVIARKTGLALVDWPVPLGDVIASRYPATIDATARAPGTRRRPRSRMP